MPRVRVPLRGGLAEDERAPRLLGGHGGPLPHARRLVHRERLVGPEDPARQRPPLRGLQGQPPLPARSDLPLLGGGRPRLPAVPRPRGRPERLREATAGGRGEHEPPRLDHHAVDPRLQRRRRREPGGGLRHRRGRGRTPDPGRGAAREGARRETDYEVLETRKGAALEGTPLPASVRLRSRRRDGEPLDRRRGRLRDHDRRHRPGAHRAGLRGG